jgi:hypothetical protein
MLIIFHSHAVELMLRSSMTQKTQYLLRILLVYRADGSPQCQTRKISSFSLQPWKVLKNPTIQWISYNFNLCKATFANRNEQRGTWFVDSICNAMDDLKEDTDILSVFTSVQRDVCQRARDECMIKNTGQTPQLQIYASSHIQVCARHFSRTSFR